LPKRKFGSNSDVSDAIDKVEVKPDSPARRVALSEELTEAKAVADPEFALGHSAALLQSPANLAKVARRKSSFVVITGFYLRGRASKFLMAAKR
jgi:hypothetical protein